MACKNKKKTCTKMTAKKGAKTKTKIWRAKMTAKKKVLKNGSKKRRAK